MTGFLAAVKQLGNGLVYIEPLSRVDPGFGGGMRPPTDPGYGRPDFGGGRPDNSLPWQPGHPDQGLPWQPGHPDQGLPWQPGHPDQGLPWGPGRPGNALPMPPVKPDQPIVLPPGVWPPQLPPGVDNSLPPGQGGEVSPPIVIPPDPDYGIDRPIYVPKLPEGVAILIALPKAQPKEGAPANAAPAILVQSGKKPVLVYVSAAATPK